MLDYDISKTATKNSKNGEENKSFCSRKNFIFFVRPGTKILMNSFLIKRHLYFVI